MPPSEFCRFEQVQFVGNYAGNGGGQDIHLSFRGALPDEIRIRMIGEYDFKHVSHHLPQPTDDMTDFEKIKALLGEARAKPKAVYCHFTALLDDRAVYGSMVDEMLANACPDFNPEQHIGFLVPEKYRGVIEEWLNAHTL